MMMTRRIPALARLAVLAVLLAAAPVAGTTSAQDTRTAGGEYVVRTGDTLFSIARRFETTVVALKQANGLTGDEIRVGQTLVLPLPQEAARDTNVGVVPSPDISDADTSRVAESMGAESSLATAADSSDAPVEVELGFIQLGSGQSLYDVAFATGLSVDSLLRLNPGVEAFMPDSSRLVVPAEYASVSYTVKSGDTLYRIARELGATIGAIRSANEIQGDVIRVGQVLTVPSARRAAPQAIALPVIAEGEIRMYPERFVGRLTASGRPYDPDAYAVSHRDLPIGSILLISVPGSDRRTFAEVSDRLPGSAQYLMDASEAVMRALGTGAEGNLRVELRVLRYGLERH